MKPYTKEELAAVITEHGKWLRNEGESRADLSGANLRGADLSGANLRGADLRGADLSRADLSGANLRSADLSGADLSRADLSGANLRSADLSGADLRGAYLRSADLSGADLSGAVQAWAQVAFMGHGQCGRMLTAVIYAEGQDAVYQCGCFIGSLAALEAYIKAGEEKHRESRTLAMTTATKLLFI
jgi:uncharacterized protein YjbI with pentapeptide repeats